MIFILLFAHYCIYMSTYICIINLRYLIIRENESPFSYCMKIFGFKVLFLHKDNFNCTKQNLYLPLALYFYAAGM